MEDYTYDLGSTEFDKQFEKIVKPTECLFVGVTASNSFNQYMSDHNIEHSNVKSLDKIGNAYGRKHSITIDGRVIPIIGIQHTSHHFEWERWNHFMMENAPLMMSSLNSLVLESLCSPEKIVRHKILTMLKKDRFHYYYVVNEKDIEFDEDDKLGWMRIWVTLGRLRDDKQLDSVTIGCYGDNVLLVEIGVRKNPNINLTDTENEEWWTKCDYKNFTISKTTENDILNWLENNEIFKEIFQ